ncbi:hypothetical protein TNCV_2746761, partial [Trichonephila clavipes]
CNTFRHLRSEVQTPGWASRRIPLSPQWVDKRVPSLARKLNTVGSRLTDPLTRTSAHASQGPQVAYTGLRTVGLGPHGLWRPELKLN